MPTIKDIAREAGVSHGTVSNVLNKTGKVGIEKIKLVQKKPPVELGYVPNAQAQMLRQGTPTSVALLLPTLREDIYLDLYQSLLDRHAQKMVMKPLFTRRMTSPEQKKQFWKSFRFPGTAAVVSVS